MLAYNKMDEIIVVVPRKALFSYERLNFEGIESNKEKIEEISKNINANLGVMRRGDAEDNANFKQPIPYAVIRNGDKVFLYERLSGGGESRLHNKLSIGAGGHMNMTESGFEPLLQENLMRELEEELDIQGGIKGQKIFGFINNDGDEVGLVHIGVGVVVDLEDGATVDVREVEQLKGSMVDISVLKSKEVYDRLEPWSKIVVDASLL